MKLGGKVRLEKVLYFSTVKAGSDPMPLGRNTTSKVSVNFGTRSNGIFGSRSKVLLIY